MRLLQKLYKALPRRQGSACPTSRLSGQCPSGDARQDNYLPRSPQISPDLALSSSGDARQEEDAVLPPQADRGARLGRPRAGAVNSVSSHLQAVNRRSWAACRSWRRRLAPTLKLEHRRRHPTSPLVMAALSLPRRSLVGHSRTMQRSHRTLLWRTCRPCSSCCTTRTSSTTRTCSSSG